MPYMQDDDLKQQLRLNTGALKTLWQVWPSAGKAFGQVKGVAQEIFQAKKLAVESGYWTNFAQEDVLRVMNDDQRIMDELDLLQWEVLGKGLGMGFWTGYGFGIDIGMKARTDDHLGICE